MGLSSLLFKPSDYTTCEAYLSSFLFNDWEIAIFFLVWCRLEHVQFNGALFTNQETGALDTLRYGTYNQSR